MPQDKPKKKKPAVRSSKPLDTSPNVPIAPFPAIVGSHRAKSPALKAPSARPLTPAQKKAKQANQAKAKEALKKAKQTIAARAKKKK